MKTNFATCSSKFELKVASCVEQTPNQYWNIAPQHCRVPIKRTSSLTVTFEAKVGLYHVMFLVRFLLFLGGGSGEGLYVSLWSYPLSLSACW